MWSRVTVKIFADLDWHLTLPHLVGEEGRIPIDGVNQAEFVLAEQDTSAREHVVTYVGDQVFAVKRRNMEHLSFGVDF